MYVCMYIYIYIYMHIDRAAKRALSKAFRRFGQTCVETPSSWTREASPESGSDDLPAMDLDGKTGSFMDPVSQVGGSYDLRGNY